MLVGWRSSSACSTHQAAAAAASHPQEEEAWPGESMVEAQAALVRAPLGALGHTGVAVVCRYLDSYYFAITTLTTVGYGDRSPHTVRFHSGFHRPKQVDQTAVARVERS